MDDRYIQDQDAAVDAVAPKPSAAKISALLPKRRSKVWPWFVVIVVVAIAGAGGWILLQNKHKTADTPTPAATTPQQSQAHKLTAAAASEEFSSNTLNIAINYPKGWEAKEIEKKLTITSPDLQLPGGEQHIDGQIQLTIEPKQASLPAFVSGSATAARDSEKLSYSAPSTMQRAQTYISFLHYASSTTTETNFDAIHVTGDAGYLAGQDIPQTDVVKGDPLIMVLFVKCPDATCSKPTKLNLSATAWEDPGLSGTIKNMLTSLVVN